MLPFRVNQKRCPFPTTPSSHLLLCALRPNLDLPASPSRYRPYREPRREFSELAQVPLTCHPKRSEGSAFSSFDFRQLALSLEGSTVNLLLFLDALDAASTITPLVATLTKNTRGWVYPSSPIGERND